MDSLNNTLLYKPSFLGYAFLTAEKKAVGIGVLNHCGESRNNRIVLAASSFVHPSMAARSWERKLRRFSAVPGTPTRSSCHPQLALSVVVGKPITEEVTMSNSTGTSTPSVFNFQSHEIRTIDRDGQPWFVAADVCAALDYANPSDAVATHLDDDERMTIANSESQSGKRGGAKLMTIINESGLYALVLRSRKPEARKFAKWVTSEVLPAIRKTGQYQSPTNSQSKQRILLEMVNDKIVRSIVLPKSVAVVNTDERDDLLKFAKLIPKKYTAVAMLSLAIRVAQDYDLPLLGKE